MNNLWWLTALLVLTYSCGSDHSRLVFLHEVAISNSVNALGEKRDALRSINMLNPLEMEYLGNFLLEYGGEDILTEEAIRVLGENGSDLAIQKLLGYRSIRDQYNSSGRIGGLLEKFIQ